MIKYHKISSLRNICKFSSRVRNYFDMDPIYPGNRIIIKRFKVRICKIGLKIRKIAIL